jgi:hypothetical protein
MNIKFIAIICLLFIVFTAAITISGDPVLPTTPYNYSVLNLPTAFTTDVVGAPRPTSVNGIDNTPTTNPVTDAGATLGRVLFYDVNLSSNRTVACAACHKQNVGFTDPSVLSALLSTWTGFLGRTRCNDGRPSLDAVSRRNRNGHDFNDIIAKNQ